MHPCTTLSNLHLFGAHMESGRDLYPSNTQHLSVFKLKFTSAFLLAKPTQEPFDYLCTFRSIILRIFYNFFGKIIYELSLILPIFVLNVATFHLR